MTYVANSQSMATSFKQDLMNGVHAFSSSYRAADTFKAALYCIGQGLSYSTPAYDTNTLTCLASTIVPGTSLTVTAVTLGYITPGMILTGGGIIGSCYVVSQTSGTTGDAGVYVISSMQTVAGTVSSTGELSGTNYVDGGVTVANANAPASSVQTAYWSPSANFVWNTLTSNGQFDSVQVYNSTAAGKNSVSVHTFGAQLVTAGTFTLTMPINAAGTALINLA